jgi:hypothetical protein
MIAKRLTVFMGPLNLDARRVIRRASNRHPEEAAGLPRLKDPNRARLPRPIRKLPSL